MTIDLTGGKKPKTKKEIEAVLEPISDKERKMIDKIIKRIKILEEDEK